MAYNKKPSQYSPKSDRPESGYQKGPRQGYSKNYSTDQSDKPYNKYAGKTGGFKRTDSASPEYGKPYGQSRGNAQTQSDGAFKPKSYGYKSKPYGTAREEAKSAGYQGKPYGGNREEAKSGGYQGKPGGYKAKPYGATQGDTKPYDNFGKENKSFGYKGKPGGSKAEDKPYGYKGKPGEYKGKPYSGQANDKPFYKSKQGAYGAKGSFEKGGYGKKEWNEKPAITEEAVKEQPETVKEEQFIENMLEGRNPVKEAIKAGRPIEKILVSTSSIDGSMREIIHAARDKGIIIQEVDRIRLDKLTQTGAHQGIIAYVSAKEYCQVQDILDYASSKQQDPFILILDGITDPQNLGSILRSAECAGVHGIIIPKRRAVGLTPVVAKASAGAIEYMRVAKVSNLTQTIQELKKYGLWVFGTAADGESYSKTNLKGALAVVIGAEGEGISQIVRKNCDRMVSIPLKGQIDSLNAAVSAAVILYEAVRQRE